MVTRLIRHIQDTYSDSDTMFSTIQIKKETKDKLEHFRRKGESYSDIIERLMNYFDDLDVEKLIDARWDRLEKEKSEYIPLNKV